MKSRALIILCLSFLLPFSAHAVPYYQVFDLGGIYQANAYVSGDRSFSINSNGMVSGWSASSPFSNSATIWGNSGATNYGTFGGGSSYALGINDQGIAVGYAETLDGNRKAAVYTNSVSQITIDSPSSYATDINNDGVIVGHYNLNSAPHFHRGFYIDESGFHDIGTLGGTNTFVRAINNNNQIVGQSDRRSGFFDFGTAFLYENGEMKSLGTLENGAISLANDVNDHGIAVGLATLAGHSYGKAVIFKDGDVVNLGNLTNNIYHSSVANGINNLNQVVGTSEYFSTLNHAFIWENDVLYDLNQFLLPDAGWTLISAHDINDNGLIVGIGARHGVTGFRGFLLNPLQENEAPSPVPEPSTLILFGLGLIAIMSRCFKKEKN